LNGGFYNVRNGVDLGFLIHLIIRYIAGCKDVVRVEAPTIPDATNVVARKDLCESARFYMANFDEPRVEKQDIGCMKSDTIGTALPFDCASITTGIALLVDINPEFSVTEKKFIFFGSEDANRAASFETVA